MLPGLEGVSCMDRLDKLGLFSLERRRWLRGDLIEVYKMMRGIDRVDSQNLFPTPPPQELKCLILGGGHALKVRGGIV